MAITRDYFPGGNTPFGFKSFYDNILSKTSIGKLGIIKGGPGTGKSSLLKKIGKHFEEQNEYVHYLHCSGDPDSLDGIYLPKYNSAMIDGTAPHNVDPRFVGAYDKIFDVGILINNKKIVTVKEPIYLLNKKIKNCYENAYANLNIAHSIGNLMKKTSSEYSDIPEIDNFCYNISKRVIKDNQTGEIRKMFISAITPYGIKEYTDSIMHDKYVIKIDSNLGDNTDLITKRIIDYCKMKKINIDIYYCPMDPTVAEHIVFSKSHIAISVSNKYHNISNYDEIVYYKDFIKNDYNNLSNIPIYEKFIEKGIYNIATAKELHDKLEEFYIEAVDFEKMNDFYLQGIEFLSD